MNENELIKFYNEFRSEFCKQFVWIGLDHNITEETIYCIFDDFEKRTKILTYYKEDNNVWEHIQTLEIKCCKCGNNFIRQGLQNGKGGICAYRDYCIVCKIKY